MNKVIHDVDFSHLVEMLDISTIGFLVKVAKYLSPHHFTSMSYIALAKLTGCSRNTAQKHIAILEQAGILQVQREYITHDRCAINGYKFACVVQFLGYPAHQNAGSLAQGMNTGVQNLGRDSVDSFVVGDVAADKQDNFSEDLSPDLTASPEAESNLLDGLDLPPINPASWALLQSVGVELNQTAREVAAYPPERVQAAIAIARPRATKNLAGYVLSILRTGVADTPPPTPPAVKENFSGGVGRISGVNKFIHENTPSDDDTFPAEQPTEPDGAPEEIPTEVDDENEAALNRLLQRQEKPPALLVYDQPMTREQWAWNAAHSQLGLQFDRATFDTWLRDATFLRYAENTYEIAVPTSHARDMCQHRLYRNIRRVLSDVLGANVELEFVVNNGVSQNAIS